MTLEQLETLAALARCGSFTKAAAELGCSQPAVSRHIQKLEQELETALLASRRGVVRLSDAGERVRAYAEAVLEGRATLLAELHDRGSRLAGDLRIVASTTPGEFLVPGFVSTFTATHPRVTPKVQIADSAEVAVQLLDRRAEVGFSGVRVPGQELAYREIAADEIVLAVPAGHPFADRGSVALAELEGQPFIMRESGSGTQMSFLAVLAEQGLPPPAYRTVMVLSTTAAIVSAVGNGYGLGLVSCLALQARGGAGPISVRIDGLSLARSLYLVVEKDRPLPAVAAAFAAWVPAEAVPTC